MRRRPSSRRPGGASAGPTPDEPSSDPAVARHRALRLLTRREHGAKELKRKLVARGIAPEQAAETVKHLAQAGWQSDARYVESLVRQRITQGYGPLRIDAELEEAGVAESLIRETLVAAGPDWKALAEELHRRRFDAPPAAGADWQKQYRFLASRGFESDQIYAALKRHPDEDEPA